MIRALLIGAELVDSAVERCLRAQHWIEDRLRPMDRLFAACVIGYVWAVFSPRVHPLRDFAVSLLVGCVVAMFGYRRRRGESANAFALRMAKAHGVVATLHVDVRVVDPATWHAIESRHPAFHADGHIEVDA